MALRPRQRQLNLIRKRLNAVHQQPGVDDDDSAYVPKVDPGNLQLFSYFAPSLKTGGHSIDVTQTIVAPQNQTKTLTSHQEFDVYGARFALPEGAVHQTYPPQGHADHSNVLPHVVLNDPHLPWEQIGSAKETSPSNFPPGLPPAGSPTVEKPRNSVPWLGLLTFTPDEIQLSPDELTELETILPKADLSQSKTTMAMKLPLSQVLQLNTKSTPKMTVATPVRDDDQDDPINGDQVVDIVFCPTALFQSFFCSYDQKGNRTVPQDGVPDLSRYAFLAHVRNVNTLKMADAGTAEQGLFSVVVSHRSGPLPGPARSITTPKSGLPPTGPSLAHFPAPVIVHLVSLQGIEQYLKFSMTPQRVALVSLCSWTYTCLPPDQINFVDAMRNVGSQVPQMLRAPDEIKTRLSAMSNATTSQRLQDRMTEGYSLLRYVVRTGESTIALSRGPLVPRLPPSQLTTFWPTEPNFSTALQILDPDLGIVDVTYSTAWELGRTLSIADKAFTAALIRVRRTIAIYATNETKKSMSRGQWSGRADVIRGLKDVINHLDGLPDRLMDGSISIDPRKRWVTKQTPVTAHTRLTKMADRSTQNARRSLFRAHAHKIATKLASAVHPGDGRLHTGPNQPEKVLPYNEINVPTSPDWALVLGWIVDKMHLYHIPPQYLVTDRSYLPMESLRFFFVDPNWVNAFVDGALSIGNNLSLEEDVIRQAMKHQLNTYFKTPVDASNPQSFPQIPTYGFLLRSAVVEAFPNLEVHVPWPDDQRDDAGGQDLDTRLQVLRLDRLDKDTLFCLIDRMPGGADLREIIITQPPHQQRFTAGYQLTGDDRTDANGNANAYKVEFEFKKAYTDKFDPFLTTRWSPLHVRAWQEGKGELAQQGIKVTDPVNNTAVFDWDNNSVILPAFANACNQALLLEMDRSFFSDSTPSAAMVGIQLNDPMQKLVINCPHDPDGKSPSQKPYSMPVDGAPEQLQTLLAALQPPAPRPTLDAVGVAPPRFLSPMTAPILRAAGNGQFISSVSVLNSSPPTNVLPCYPLNRFDGSKNHKTDLLFSLRRVPNPNPGNLLIWSVVITIPTGDEASSLSENWGNTNLTLLQNTSSFNIGHKNGLIADPDDPSAPARDAVTLSILARANKKLARLDETDDLSFTITGLVLNGVPGEVHLQVTESYKESIPWREGGKDGQLLVDRGTGRTTVTAVKVAATDPNNGAAK